MKNKYNLLVTLLVLACLADSAYRIYKVYRTLVEPRVCKVK